MSSDHSPLIPISVVIITKNEADRLDLCLASLKDFSDIVVVDSHSTDQTQERARHYGARVIERAFNGYGDQKKFAVSQAKEPWILSLDADEMLSPAFISDLKQLLQRGVLNPATGYSIKRTLMLQGQPLKASGENRRPILRLFHRDFFNFNNLSVHEEVVPLHSHASTNAVTSIDHQALQGEVWHYSYRHWNDYLQRLNRYTLMMAQEFLKRRPQGPGPRGQGAWILLRALWVFIKIFIFQCGFRDGTLGLHWALCCGYANYLKYLKINELYHRVQWLAPPDQHHPSPTKGVSQ